MTSFKAVHSLPPSFPPEAIELGPLAGLLALLLINEAADRTGLAWRVTEGVYSDRDGLLSGQPLRAVIGGLVINEVLGCPDILVKGFPGASSASLSIARALLRGSR